MGVTQKDIAKQAGISRSLVSRVLSGRARDVGISLETEERVRKAAEELGYVPNAAAQSLKGASTRTIGVVVYDFSDPFFGSSIAYLQAEAHKENYSLVLAGFLKRQPHESDLQPLKKTQLDGIIILGSGLDNEWLSEFNVPVARVGYSSDNEKSHRVIIDEQSGAELIMRHIAERKYAHVSALDCNLFHQALRIEQLQRAAQKSGIEFSAISGTGQSPYETGFNEVKSLIERNALPRALVCVNDTIAMGAAAAALDAGLKIPQDLAVIGYDDIPTVKQFYPNLTTIRHPLQESTRLALRAIIDKISTGVSTLPCELIVRASS